MRQYIYILTVVLVFATSLSAVYAQTRDSLVECKSSLIHFRIAQTLVDGGYMNNAAELSRLKSAMSHIYSDARCSIDSVVVEVKSSPDGDYRANVKLTQARAKSLKNYLYLQFPQLRDENIITRITPENWSGLRDMITEDSQVPLQKRVLEIIDLTNGSNLRKQQLRVLNKGITYAYIKRHILPSLRNGTVCTVWYRIQNDTIQRPTPVCPILISAEVAADSTILDNAILSSDQQSDSSLYLLPTATAAPLMQQQHLPPPSLLGDRVMPNFALKTNLLYLAALCLNIEGELYVGNRWSINLDYQYAWWSNKSKHKYYRLAAVSPEVRYWFASKSNFKGHFAGIYVGAGIYELMAQPTKGIQGEFFIAGGVTYGWAFQATKWMNIELSVGVGYMMSEYRQYYHDVDCYVYSDTQRFTYFGPTKAKVSLVFPLHIGKRLNRRN